MVRDRIGFRFRIPSSQGGLGQVGKDANGNRTGVQLHVRVTRPESDLHVRPQTHATTHVPRIPSCSQRIWELFPPHRELLGNRASNML